MDAEFNRLMGKVLLSGLILFGLAAGALVIFFRGLGKEGGSEKSADSSHAVRAGALIGILGLACVYFIWLAYR